ncbi:MAG: C40 family peptidase [Anaerovoracaceae bacterium]|jgi:cell wall-associated NlpC family hydrolase
MVFSVVSFADTDSEAYAADSSTDITSQYLSSAITLYQCGLLSGTEDKGFDLDSAATRLQGVQEAVRLIGSVDMAQSGRFPTKYSDVPDNATGFPGYLEYLGVDVSRNDTEFGYNDQLTAPCYLVILLQTLGYQDITKYSSEDEIYAKAVSVGLVSESDVSQLKSVAFTRGTLAYISRKALDVTVNGTNYNVYQMLLANGDLQSIAYPSDVVIYGKSALGTAVVNEAYKYMGVKYVGGGRSPSGFDCSGYVGYVMIQAGVWDRFYGDCNSVSAQCTEVSTSEARAGDLVFFSGTSGKSGYTHVGIYIGDGKMINCASSKGVSIANVYTGYWGNHFAAVERPNAMM